MDAFTGVDPSGGMNSRIREATSAAIDQEVETIINVFNGKVCCLACCFKIRGLDASLVEFLLREGISVQALWDGDSRTMGFCRQFSRENLVLGYMCARAVIESNHPNQALVVHRGYYQKDDLELSYSMQTSTVKIGKIRRGQSLVIFHQDSLEGVAISITEKLLNEFSTAVIPSRTFPNLPNVPNDEFGKLCTKTGFMNKGRVVENLVCYEALAIRNWHASTSLEKKNVITGFFEKFPKVALVIVELDDYDEDGMSAVKPWMELFERFGTLDDVILVFTVDYNAFLGANINSKSEARHRFMENIPVEQRSRVMWMDISVDNIANVDGQDHVNLSVTPLVP